MKRDGKSYEEAKAEVQESINECIRNREKMEQEKKDKELAKSPKDKFNEDFTKMKNGK